jgi:VanZ family protein
VQTIKTTRGYRLLLAAGLAVTSYLALTSREIPGVANVNDKVEHVLAFCTLALLADFSWPRSGFGAAKSVSLLGYGLAIEITQYFLPYRECSLLDLSADAAGLFLYWLAVPALKKLLLFRSRWQDGGS